MATSSEDIGLKNMIRKYRKKLRQIEHLERLNRTLSPEEEVKVENKYNIRDHLQSLLAEYEEENQKAEESIEHFKTDSFENEESLSNELTVESHSAQEKVRKDASALLKSHETGDGNIHESQKPARETSKDVGTKVAEKTIKPQNPAAGDHGARQEKKKKSSKQSLASSQFKVTFLEGHSDWTTVVVLHKDIIVTASHDTTVKTWDVLSGQELKNFGGHTNGVTCLVVLDEIEARKSVPGLLQNDEETVIVSGSFDCTLKVWALNSGQQLKSVYTYNPVTKISNVSALGLVVIGTDTGKLELWDLDKGELRYSLCAYDASVTGIKVTDKQLQSCASDGTIKVYNISDDLTLSCVFESEDIKSTLGGFVTSRHVRSLELCEKGTLIGDDARNIKVLNWRRNEADKISNHHADFSSTDAIRCHGDYIIASSYDLDLGLGYLNVRCSHTLDYLATFDDKDTERILAMDFGLRPNGNMIIATGGTELKVWEILKQPSKQDKSEDILRAEFRQSLAGVAIDSDEDDEDDENSETDESDSDSRTQRQAAETGSWFSWCSVL